MEFGLLGPLLVRDDEGRAVDLPKGGLRTLLVVLLGHANAAVSADRLAEHVWGGRQPRQPRQALQVMAVRLRKHLGPASAQRLRADQIGYVLSVQPGELDVQCFEDLHRRGSEACKRGDWPNASVHLSQALQLWRGRPLDGIPADQFTDALVHRLEEMRLQAFADRVDADLSLGRQAQVLSELTETVTLHPLNERFRGQLMLSLHRSGRTADALACFRQGRRTLIRELGVEPGQSLADLHLAILANHSSAEDPASARHPPADGRAAALPSAGPVHCRLPTGSAGFVGRSRQLAQIVARCADVGAAGGPVLVLSGQGGVGKSALAVHAAGQLRAVSQDGQLFTLLSAGDRPRPALDVLGELIGALTGGATRAPDSLEGRAALWRSLTSGRRILLVLDDARSAAQVRPLLPGPETGPVLITSRSRLPGLAGRQLVEVDTLPRHESVDLLRRAIGSRRADAEPEELDALAGLCADLPLALHICGSRLAGRNTWSVRSFLGRLQQARRRLDELSDGDLAVRAGIESSLPPPGAPSPTGTDFRTDFALLGLIGETAFATSAVAALLDAGPPQAEDFVEQLVDLHLLTTPEPGRYRFHDLVLEVAHEQAQWLAPVVHRAAIGRWADWAAATAWQTERLVNTRRVPARFELDWVGSRPAGPEPVAAETAWSWFARELPALLAAARAAAGAELPRPAAVISLATAGPARTCGQWTLAEALARVGVDATEAVADSEARIAAVNDLAIALAVQKRFDEALPWLDRSMSLARSAGNLVRESQAGLNLAVAARHMRQPTRALRSLESAIVALDSHETQDGPDAMTLRVRRSILLCRGNTLADAEDNDSALSVLQNVRRLAEEAGDEVHVDLAHFALGRVHVALGEHQLALGHCRSALRGFEARTDQESTANALHILGLAEAGLGSSGAAVFAWRRAYALLRDLGDPEAETVLALLRAADAEE